jgi:riboflavin biosynthesis pyrimidine reductase
MRSHCRPAAHSDNQDEATSSGIAGGRYGNEQSHVPDFSVARRLRCRALIAGGAQTVRQYIVAGLLDELVLTIAPVILGSGERLLDDVGKQTLQQMLIISSPSVTHIRYRFVR